MINKIIAKLFGKEENGKVKHPKKFRDFDNFLYVELIEYLAYIREFMNPTLVNAEFLAKTDAMIYGFGHALEMSDTHNLSCSCCLYWCAGSNCPIVKESWQLFIEELANIKVLFVKTEL